MVPRNFFIREFITKIISGVCWINLTMGSHCMSQLFAVAVASVRSSIQQSKYHAVIRSPAKDSKPRVSILPVDLG